MPARDLHHEAFRNALIKDGWTITDDPLRLAYGRHDVYIDLGVERPIAAEKAGRKIAVEVKGFLGASELRDLEMAIGQYQVYRSVLSRVQSDRALYLAVPEDVYEGLLNEPIARTSFEDARIALIVFRPREEEIVRWQT